MTSAKMATHGHRDPGNGRCPWCGSDPLYTAYHDLEWGVPLHDDRGWFEALVLDGAQAGLSWISILRRRESYRRAFDNYDVQTIARYSDAELEARLADTGIIRNRRKIYSVRSNARATLGLLELGLSLNRFFWRYVDGTPVVNHWREQSQVPTETATSRRMSRDLKQAGFSFVGPTICYAMMQATGMVNDHLTGCFRHSEVSKQRR